MNPDELIASGNLELYVYGLLTDAENLEIAQMAKNNKDVAAEIISIEKAILNLSTSFSPMLSAENFERIKAKLQLKYQESPKKRPRSYLGWAASLLLLIGLGLVYDQYTDSQQQNAVVVSEKNKLQETVVDLEIRNRQTLSVLEVIQDPNNKLIALAGQAAAPESSARVYWNAKSKAVYVDASQLPTPPEGKVYQVWSLTLEPLTPTSIGLLENFEANGSRVFAVSESQNAQAFGITLEPAGGSKSPTMDQLYVLGKA